jgi:hypothetical protein
VPAIDQTDADWPGAIYYATGDGPASSTVEQVEVHLGAGDDAFRVDSSYAYGTTSVHGGAGRRYPHRRLQRHRPQPREPGPGRLHRRCRAPLGDAGPDLIVIDDAGDDNANVGSYLGDTVTGLDMPATGSITLR